MQCRCAYILSGLFLYFISMDLLLKDYLAYLNTQRKLSTHTQRNYNYALNRVNIQSVDTANLGILWAALTKLLDGGMSYGYVQNYNALVRGMLTHNSISYSKSFDYKTFK